MVNRARLSPPRARPAQKWHAVTHATVSAAELTSGDRRLEAEAYLSGGYGLRVRLESWHKAQPLGSLAKVRQPSRLKGVLVGRDQGTPFLAATQVFDIQPTPRKWLALDKTPEAADRFVEPGTILVTRSGAVGLTTIAHSPHRGVLISDDLLRCDPTDRENTGWIYAYLRTPAAREMMQSAKYGHVIKHLEVAHLNALPLPLPPKQIRDRFEERVRTIFEQRDKAHELMVKAEGLLTEALGGPVQVAQQETGFEVHARAIVAGRRRLDGAYHNPRAAAVLTRFKQKRIKTQPLSEITERVWWETRFRRVFGPNGVPYLSAEDLFSLNPPVEKRVMVEQAEQPERFFVKRGWIVMACSGQVYGLVGSVALMAARHEKAFMSHDLIRITPSSSIRSGYLFACLGHPIFGRPLLLRLAYGTSIPHLDPGDVATFPVPRVDDATEAKIAAAMEKAADLRSAADELENAINDEAEELVRTFADTGRFRNLNSTK